MVLTNLSYLHVIQTKKENTKNNNVCGIDMGVATSITLSNGTKYDISVGESE